MDFSAYGLTPPNDDAKWTAIRNIRGRLLQECDWTQLPDAPLTLSEKQAWAMYRQTLRNLPEDFAGTDDVVIPNPPGSEA